MRFNDEGQAETIGGWESVIQTALTGVCRNIFAWTDNAATLTLALGTHSNLQLWQGGGLYDVTPTLAKPSATLGASPLSVTNASAVVVVTHTAHGLTSGDTVAISGAAAVGGITPNGTFPITVTGPSAYEITFTSPASSTATGGGSAVVVAPQNPYAAGQINGTGSAGFGTGGYGIGGYGQPSATEYFPRTWSFGAYGQNLIANFHGGPIYAWTNSLVTKAAPLANSPQRVTHMLVARRQVFALGCNEEASGTFNPLCIRHSGVGRNTEWNTDSATTAREYILPGGGWIVAGRLIGDRMLVWTNDTLFVGSYKGSLTQPWQFDAVVDRGAGLIGQNAVVVRGQTAYWITPDLQFMAYQLGALGGPSPIPCPIQSDFAENLAFSQFDKIVASSVGKHGEIRFDYPDARDGIENSRYIALRVTAPQAGAWYRGIMDRSAMVDAGPNSFPCGATPDGRLYWHERGHSADGGVLSWFIETGDQMLSEDASIHVLGMWPDFKNQLGPVVVDLTSRFKPNGSASVRGPYAVAATDDKADMRASGRYFRIRFSGASAPSFARIGSPVFDTRPGGQR